ncbi:MAG: 5-(carboxyamino)imidazole ribonucleotide synthase [Sulfuricaulis sp.]
MIVGIVGGGQLARMLALAGIPLGLKFIFLDPAPDACAAVLGEHLCAAYNDRAALAYLAKKADCVSFEFENVPADILLSELAGKVPLFPAPSALALAQDRLQEKHLLQSLGIPIADFEAVDSRADLERAVAKIGFPAVLKTRTLGYDGKGQAVLRSPGDLDRAWQQLGGAALVLEGFVAFEREVSIIAVRGHDGQTAFYPLAENTHHDGILRYSQSRPGHPLLTQAVEYAQSLLDRLDYVGVLAVEYFVVCDGLLANEFAPRVHNSGHWTIEGARTSQFENHLRAILGLPLGSVAAVGYSGMVNFIGELPAMDQVLALPDVHLHIYGKKSRGGRKVGHATLCVSDEQARPSGLKELFALAQGSAKPSFPGRSDRQAAPDSS